jgi:hypothetical protein
MTGSSQRPDHEAGKIDDLSPEEINFRDARKLFIAAILTPVYWLLLFFFIATVAEWKGVGDVDSVFVSIMWGVLSLVYTVAVTYQGVQRGRMIRDSESQRGRTYARGAAIIGAIFTVMNVFLAVALLTD